MKEKVSVAKTTGAKSLDEGLRKAYDEKIKHLASFPELNPNPVLEVDYSGKIIFSNLAAKKVLKNLGLDEKDTAVFLPKNREEILSKLKKSGEAVRREFSINDKVFGETIHISPEFQSMRIYAYDITERKQAEEELKRVNERFILAQQSAGAGVWDWNILTGKLDWSPALFRIFGLDPGKTESNFDVWKNTIHPDDRNTADERIRNALRDHVQLKSEYRIIFPNGELHWINALGNTLYDAGGQALRMSGICIDITERKKAEEALRKNEDELRKLNRTLKALSDSNQAMMRATNETDYLNEVCKIIVNDCGHSMAWIGFAEQDVNKTVRPVAQAGFDEGYLDTVNITWGDTERGRGPTGTTIRTGKFSICRNMLTDPNFTPWREQAIKRDYASSIVLPLTAAGKTFGAITIYSKEPDPFSEKEVELLSELADDLVYGITIIRLHAKQAKAEEALADSQSELSAMVENVPLITILVDKNRIVKKVNAAATKFTGLRVEEMVGKRSGEALRCIHAFDDPNGCGFGPSCKSCPLRQVISDTFEHGANYHNVETKNVFDHRGKREELTFLVSTSLIKLSKEQLGLVSIEDITGRKYRENEIKRLASFPERDSSPIIELTATGVVSYMNMAARIMFPDLEKKGSSHPYLSDWKGVVKNAKNGRNNTFERDVNVKGRWFHQHCNFIPEFNKIRIYGMDVHESKQADDFIKKSLNEKEVLLKEVHHRVKNNLQLISSLLHLQQMKVGGKNAEVLKDSQNRIKSIGLVHEILYSTEDFSGVTMAKYLKELVNSLIRTYSKSEISVHYDLGDTRLKINTAIPCGLIVNELVTNSLKHAFPKGAGKINISMKETGENIEMIVSDNGVGMPHDHDWRSSDSLGLKLVNSLTDQLDGKVEFTGDNGTTFKIMFPNK